MNKPVFKIFMVTCLVALTGWIVFSQGVGPDDKPGVIKAVAPRSYPPVAKAARAGGKVVVKVTMDAAGTVTSAKVISGHPLLHSVSLEAAGRWLFSVAEKKDAERSVELEFSYRQVDEQEEEDVFFTPPYGVEITSAPGRIH